VASGCGGGDGGGEPLPAPAGCGELAADFPNPYRQGLSDTGELLYPGHVKIHVRPPPFALCPRGYDYPKLQGVTVKAPDGQVLPASVVQRKSHRFQMDFEAASPGLYTSTFTYEVDAATGKPPLVYEVGVIVVRDRREVLPVRLPRKCTDLDRTSRGTWLCDAAVFRDGVLVEELAADWRYTVRGDTVWGVNKSASLVGQWKDTGQGPLVRVASGSTNSSSNFLSHWIGPQAFLVRYNNFVRSFSPSVEGTLPTLMTTTVPADFDSDFMSHEGLVLMSRPLSKTEGSQSRLCTYRLETTEKQVGDTCVEGYPGGVSEEGLWLAQPGLLSNQYVNQNWLHSATGLSLWLPGAAGPQKVGEVYGPGWANLNVQTRTGTPVFTYQKDNYAGEPEYALLPRLEGEHGATLDAFLIPGMFRGARRDFVWGVEIADPTGKGDTLIFLR
jgi:hypothetical protein